MDFQEMMAKREEMKKNAVGFVTAGAYKKDERFWEITTGKDGNGSAIIRFLPQPNFDLNPVVRRIRHTFKLKGKTFFDYCPKTLGWDEECPICDELGPLYDDYQETPQGKKYTHQNQITLLKRKNEYITNILVVNDPNNPDNNGKVFLFRVNGVILEFYQKAINPPAEMITPKIVYDYIEGCNFQYIIIGPTKKGDFNDYKSSNFQAISPIADNQERMQEIWKASYLLAEFTDPKQFKSYDDINKNFRKIYFNESIPANIPGNTVPTDDAIKRDNTTIITNPFDKDTNLDESAKIETDKTVNIEPSTTEFNFNTPDPNIVKEEIPNSTEIKNDNIEEMKSEDGFIF
jgi:hypothetical protein